MSHSNPSKYYKHRCGHSQETLAYRHKKIKIVFSHVSKINAVEKITTAVFYKL